MQLFYVLIFPCLLQRMVEDGTSINNEDRKEFQIRKNAKYT